MTLPHHISLCAGIDPQLMISNPFLANQLKTYGVRSFLMRYSECVIGALPAEIRTVKFQSAYFEARGHEGIHALKFAIELARQRGKFSILDAKRGDIGSTMEAYGAFAFEYLGADSLTVNPFVGMSCIDGISKWLAAGKSVFLVMFTSSGKGDVFQENLLAQMSQADSGISQFFSLIESSALRSQIGIVIGAQRIDGIEESVLERLRKFHWLVPGIGAQGGGFSERLKLRSRDPSSTLIAISRDLTGNMQSPDLGLGNSIASWSDLDAAIRQRSIEYCERIRVIS